MLWINLLVFDRSVMLTSTLLIGEFATKDLLLSEIGLLRENEEFFEGEENL
jgi:hypothetical protein